MSDAEFDRFADEYHKLHARNISLSGEEPAYFAEYKAKDAARWSGNGLPCRALLDFGSGVGNSLPYLNRYFPRHRLVALDVSDRCLDISRSRFGNLAEFVHFDGLCIPCPDGTFGLAFAACVFHHIEPSQRPHMLSELFRVLAPGGWLILHEHNPWNPLTVRAVNDCPLDENAELISARKLRRQILSAGFTSAEIRYRIFFPSWLSAFRPLEKALTWLPLGAQYGLCCRK